MKNSKRMSKKVARRRRHGAGQSTQERPKTCAERYGPLYQMRTGSEGVVIYMQGPIVGDLERDRWENFRFGVDSVTVFRDGSALLFTPRHRDESDPKKGWDMCGLPFENFVQLPYAEEIVPILKQRDPKLVEYTALRWTLSDARPLIDEGLGEGSLDSAIARVVGLRRDEALGDDER